MPTILSKHKLWLELFKNKQQRAKEEIEEKTKQQ
jgi:hypothetical protein